MPNYLVLLRGVNVGGYGRVPMADLRRLLEGLGHGAVSTYLQSGNALFTSARTDEAALGTEIEQALARELGVTTRCLLRDRAALERIVAGNPLAGIATDPARMHVFFLQRPPDTAALAAVDPATYAPVVLAPGEREVFGWFPDGMGRSKLTQAFFEKRLAAGVATARNWNTVTSLLAQMGG